MTQEDTDARCNFCGRSYKEVQRLIAGPGVYVCDSCVTVCKRIMDKELGVKVCANQISAKEIKQRLAVLRKVRTQGEITEADYQARLKSVLDLMQTPCDSECACSKPTPPRAKRLRAARKK